MTRLWLQVALAGLATASKAVAPVSHLGSPSKALEQVENAFIMECQDNQQVESLAEAVTTSGGQVRHKYDSDVLHGISVDLGNVTQSEQLKASMGKCKRWPMTIFASKTVNQQQQQHKRQKAADKAGQKSTTPDWRHTSTQVDKLHQRGLMGSGIKIAVVDTGVNYKDEALGGCFGKGCRVAFGDYTVFGGVGKAGDPVACHSHGTTVARLLAGNSSKYLGVAPNATLMAYRILDCDPREGSEDDFIQGWVRAFQDGAQIIVSSTGIPGQNWASSLLASVVSRISKKGITCVVGTGNDGYLGLFNGVSPSSGSGVISVNAHDKNGGISEFSSYGPSWELDIKPSILGPSIDGTSFAGPVVAGIAALVAEARGTLDPAILRSLLISTARPTGPAPKDLYTVAQQGGGLVAALDAVEASTLVEPATLPFNDTEHRVPYFDLKLTNTANSRVNYKLSSQAATTLYALDSGSTSVTQGDPIQAEAGIRISQSSVALDAGKSTTVRISATDPTGVDTKRLPLWSGWIMVNGSDGKNLSIPYLGLAGSLRSVPVIGRGGLSLRKRGGDAASKDDFIFFTHPKDKKRPGNDEIVDVIQLRKTYPKKLYGGHLTVEIDRIISSPEVHLDIVPVKICPQGDSTSLATAPNKGTGTNQNGTALINPTELCFPSSGVGKASNGFGLGSIGEVKGFPRYYESGRPTKLEFEWDGAMANGDYIPLGKYKIVVRALAMFGNPSVQSDWYTSESIEFHALYIHNQYAPPGWDKTSSVTTPAKTGSP